MQGSHTASNVIMLRKKSILLPDSRKIYNITRFSADIKVISTIIKSESAV